jgi:hypothetical protein
MASSFFTYPKDFDFSQETWHEIPKYVLFYQVSNYGRVKSVHNGISKLMLVSIYGKITLTKNSEKEICEVSELQKAAGIPPENLYKTKKTKPEKVSFMESLNKGRERYELTDECKAFRANLAEHKQYLIDNPTDPNWQWKSILTALLWLAPFIIALIIFY